jgi:hypothetical protein
MSRRNLTILPPYGRRPGGSSLLLKLAITAAAAAIAFVYGATYALFFPFLILELTLPLLVIALMVIWALPDSKNAPTRLLSSLFFAFFVFMLIWPDYLALQLAGLPWITMRRLLAVPMLATFLICLSVSSSFRSELKQILSAAPAIWKLVAAFVALQLMSIALSSDPGFSADKFIVAQLYWTAPFFIGCYLMSKPDNVTRWVALFCLMLVPLGFLGVWESINSRVPWADHIPSFLVVADESVQRILKGQTRAGTGIYRVQSTFTTSLAFAEYLALVTPFLIHYVMGSFRSSVRLLAMAALGATLYLIILTDARLGAVGFFLAGIGYSFLWAVRRWKRERESLFAPLIVIAYPAFFGLFIAATLTVGRLRRMVWGGGEHQASTDARTQQYLGGFDILTTNPIGHGIGMGAERLGFRNPGGVLTIDTYYLTIALEYGVIGFIVFYGLLLTAAFRAGTGIFSDAGREERHYLLPAAVALGNFLVIKSVFSSESNHTLPFMILAMIVALLYRPQQDILDGQGSSGTAQTERPRLLRDRS